GHLHRYVGLELRALGARPLPRRRQAGGPPEPLRAAVLHRGAQQQLLPVAAELRVRLLAAAPAGRLLDVGEGAAWADARQTALRPRGVGGPDLQVLARAGRQAGRAAGAAGPRPGARRRPPGALPAPAAPVDAYDRRAQAPQLAQRRGVRPARAASGGVLRDERCLAALRPSSHGTVRVRAPARLRPAPSVRRLLSRRGPAVVGRPAAGVGGGGQGRLRLLQQRRGRQRRPQRGDAEAAARSM
ncbi:MAG: FIG003003: hypothetical protein, partial [uncultured Nocardioidaceae bacterium]